MRRMLILVMMLALLGPTPGLAASGLAGTACKAGTKSRSVAGKLLQCKRVKSKWLWTVVPKSAVQPKPISTPLPNVSPSPSTAPDLSKSELITSSAQFLPIESCRAVDLTQRPHDAQGFPRPGNVLSGSSSARILVLPFSVSDKSFTDDDLRDLKSAMESTAAFYTRVSYGQLKLAVDYADRSQWIAMPKSADDYGLISPRPQQNNEAFVREIIAAASSTINFDRYDSIILESARWTESGGGQGFVGETFPAASGTARRINLHWGNAAQRSSTIRHELGHTLFGLEDLYLFKGYGTPFHAWDIMSGDGLVEGDFSGWNKFLIGWLAEQNIACVGTAATLYLAPLRTSSEKPQLALIPVMRGVTVAVEARYESRSTAIPGALVYVVDSRIQHGEGPISSIQNLLKQGESIDRWQWRIKVLESNETGLLVSMERI